MASVRADFDRIALLSQEGWDHNSHYHNYLLKHLPAHCADALEIGCGTGAFSRLLAQRSERVLALDLSPQMIRVAQERSAQYLNICYPVADVLEWAFPVEQFDCIASIATLHHLPLADMLGKMKRALKPNGVLLVLDLYQQETIMENLSSLITFPVSIALKLVKNGLTKAAMFGPDGTVLQPSEALYKKNVLVLRGRFRPVTHVNVDMLLTSRRHFKNEPDVDKSTAVPSQHRVGRAGRESARRGYGVSVDDSVACA